LECHRHRFRAVDRLKLGEDIFDVKLGRRAADEQGLGNDLIIQSLH
jgi:hypothetical protein